MARVFKKHIVRYLDAEGRQVPKGTPGARKVSEKSAKWYGRVPGEAKPVPLCRKRGAAERLLHEKIRKAEREQIHAPGPFEAYRLVPLVCPVCRGSGHGKEGACDCPGGSPLSDYRRSMEAKDKDPRYVSQAIAHCAAILGGTGALVIADIHAHKVESS